MFILSAIFFQAKLVQPWPYQPYLWCWPCNLLATASKLSPEKGSLIWTLHWLLVQGCFVCHAWHIYSDNTQTTERVFYRLV